MKAPLRPMLLVLGALSLGGVVVLKNAHASQSFTFDTNADHIGQAGGGGGVTLGGKDGGHIELGGKEDGGIALAAKGKEGGSVKLVDKAKDVGDSIELVDK